MSVPFLDLLRFRVFFLSPTFTPMLYTLCTNAVGNRTLCDMCQSKAYRKQMRHKQEHKNAEHATTEDSDGTTDQSKSKSLPMPWAFSLSILLTFSLSFSFSLSLLFLPLYIDYSLFQISYLDHNRDVFPVHICTRRKRIRLSQRNTLLLLQKFNVKAIEYFVTI